MFSNWLDEHIETFIKVHVGYVPDPEVSLRDKTCSNNYYLTNFSDLHLRCLVGVWNESKRRAAKLGLPIILAGRDVWLLEVLARLENYPTTFIPQISSLTCHDSSFKNYANFYLVDTGCRGTVPKAMGIKNFGLISYASSFYFAGSNPRSKQEFDRLVVAWYDRRDHLLFPNMRPTRLNENKVWVGCKIPNLYSYLEGHPKYWTRAVYAGDGKTIDQTIDHSYIRSAAEVTVHVARGVMRLFPNGFKRRPC